MATNIAVAPAQPLRALERANEVRLARADLKRKIGSGARSLAEIVVECPSEATGMTVSDLLTSQRRWGRARSRRLLLSLQLNEAKALGELTPRQRHLLAAMLGVCPTHDRALEPVVV